MVFSLCEVCDCDLCQVNESEPEIKHGQCNCCINNHGRKTPEGFENHTPCKDSEEW